MTEGLHGEAAAMPAKTAKAERALVYMVMDGGSLFGKVMEDIVCLKVVECYCRKLRYSRCGDDVMDGKLDSIVLHGIPSDYIYIFVYIQIPIQICLADVTERCPHWRPGNLGSKTGFDHLTSYTR